MTDPVDAAVELLTKWMTCPVERRNWYVTTHSTYHLMIDGVELAAFDDDTYNKAMRLVPPVQPVANQERKDGKERTSGR